MRNPQQLVRNPKSVRTHPVHLVRTPQHLDRNPQHLNRRTYVTSCLTVSHEVSLDAAMPWARNENSAGFVAAKSASS